MKKATIIIVVSILLIFLFLSCPKAKEAEKKETPLPNKDIKEQITPEEQIEESSPSAEESEEDLPLITEVMSKEALQTYVKKKGIKPIAKENFKKPEVVWEKTYDEYIRPFNVSDLTENGNSIVVTGDDFDRQRSFLFLDDKGNIRKKIIVKPRNSSEEYKSFCEFTVAGSGKGAVVAPTDISLTYYNEEGKELWKKERMTVLAINKLFISYNGESIALEELNPNWNEESWNDGDVNTSRALFFDKKGKQLFEYKGFAIMASGEFSRDGNYFAGFLWWQDNSNIMGKLIYISMKEKKVVWEKPFTFNRNPGYEQKGCLAVSEKGSYIAVMDFSLAKYFPERADDFIELDVFNQDGELIFKTKASNVNWIDEEGLLKFQQQGDNSSIANIFESKILCRVNKSSVNFNNKNYIMSYYRVDADRYVYPQIYSIFEELLWDSNIKGALETFTRDGNYLKVHVYGGEKSTKIIFFGLK